MSDRQVINVEVGMKMMREGVAKEVVGEIIEAAFRDKTVEVLLDLWSREEDVQSRAALLSDIRDFIKYV